MADSPCVTGVAAVLFDRLIDDAGLFPPANLTMEAALRRFARDAEVGSAVLSHRFVCPVARLPELLVVAGAGAVIPLVVVTPLIVTVSAEQAALESVSTMSARPAIRLTAVEIGPGRSSWRELEVDVPNGVNLFVELSPGPSLRGHLCALAQRGWSAKVRCGGRTPDLIPTPAELASFIMECISAGVPFKATAGLHRAVRSHDAGTGVLHHGFLNLLLAVCAASRGEGVRAVSAVLAETDPRRLIDAVQEIDAPRAKRAREIFTSYGSCDTGQPLEDLVALGLLARSADAGAPLSNRSSPHV
jgi:hypothetical protein